MSSNDSQQPITWSHAVTALLSLAGLGDALYLTVQDLTGQSLRCTIVSGCSEVLSSPYAHIGPVPLALPIRPPWPSPTGAVRRRCLFHGIQSGDPGGLWLSISQAVVGSAGNNNVSDDFVVALFTNLCHPPLLPVLPAFSGSNDNPNGNCMGIRNYEAAQLISSGFCEPFRYLPRLTFDC